MFFRAANFQPTFSKFEGEVCGGAQLHVLDRAVFQPFRTAIAILRHVRSAHGAKFEWKEPPYEYEYHRMPIEVLLGSPLQSFFPE